MSKKRVVVTGLGVVSCFGSDVDLFFKRLLNGESGVAPIERFPVEEYPTRFAASVRDFDTEGYIDKKQARRVDPFVRYGMVAGKKALEHAKLMNELDTLDKERCGIIIGSGMGGMEVFYDGTATVLTKGFKRLTPFFVPYIITNMAGALLSIDLGFMGPNYSVSTACSTANYAIYLAAEHIRNGTADLMLAGGTEAAVNPIGLSGFVACKALSERNDDCQKASRPWDQGRDGFVMGEGAGVLVLEEYEHAKKRGATILAEYMGGSVTTDAYHITDPRSDGLGMRLCIDKALKDAGVPKERVNYINAHATSTPAGDLCEIRAIKQHFGSHVNKLKINATKSMIGHGLGAAGGFASIVCVQSILQNKLHPSINIENIEPEVADIDVVSNGAIDHKVDVALANTVGFGGHNACIAFAPFKP